MAKQLQLRRGTSAQHSTFTGAAGEVTIDTDKDVVVVHDGATAGGFPSQKELISGTNIKTINSTSLLGSGNIDVIQTISVTNIDELKDFVAPYDNYALNVLGYSEAGDGGGGVFYWDATKDKAEHNGGTVIDPSITFPTDWTNQTQLEAWFAAGSSGIGCWVRQYDGAVNVRWFGAKGDGVTDDTAAIQAALYYNFDIDNYNNNSNFVFIPAGKYRITDSIHQPSGCKVVGVSNPHLNISITTNSGSIIYADIPDTDNKSAWIISGLDSSGVLNDPMNKVITTGAYNAGTYTYQHNILLHDIMFYTDVYTKCAVAVGAAQEADIKIGFRGFLTGITASSSWNIKIEATGQAYHCGIFTYNCNGGMIKGGYIIGDNTPPVDLPTFDVTTAPSGWSTSATENYYSGNFYYTTGIAQVYGHAIKYINPVIEHNERGILLRNATSTTMISPYFESITELAYHCIASNCTVLNPSITNTVGSIGSVGGQGNLKIIDGNILTKTAHSSSQTTYGAVSRITMEKAYPSLYIDEVYHPSVDYIITDKRDFEIIVSSTGDDLNTGIGTNNPVLTLNQAIVRAQYYGIDKIRIVDSENISVNASTTLNRDLTIYADTSATITPTLSGGNIPVCTFLNCKIHCKNLTFSIPTPSGSWSQRAMFVPKGLASITFEDSTITCNTGAAVVNGGYKESSNLTLIFLSCNVTADILCANPYNNNSSNTLIYTSIDSTLSGTLTVQSNFNKIN